MAKRSSIIVPFCLLLLVSAPMSALVRGEESRALSLMLEERQMRAVGVMLEKGERRQSLLDVILRFMPGFIA